MLSYGAVMLLCLLCTQPLQIYFYDSLKFVLSLYGHKVRVRKLLLLLYGRCSFVVARLFVALLVVYKYCCWG